MVRVPIRDRDELRQLELCVRLQLAIRNSGVLNWSSDVTSFT